jgi:hypothetical protein
LNFVAVLATFPCTRKPFNLKVFFSDFESFLGVLGHDRHGDSRCVGSTLALCWGYSLNTMAPGFLFPI